MADVFGCLLAAALVRLVEDTSGRLPAGTAFLVNQQAVARISEQLLTERGHVDLDELAQLLVEARAVAVVEGAGPVAGQGGA